MSKEFSIAELEAKHTYPDDRRIPHVPFDFNNAEWERFKAQIEPGDKIRSFDSSPETGNTLLVEQGIFWSARTKLSPTLSR